MDPLSSAQATGSEVEDEERALENQLELQLKDQRDSLAAISDALAFDPSNPELLLVLIFCSLTLSISTSLF